MGRRPDLPGCGEMVKLITGVGAFSGALMGPALAYAHYWGRMSRVGHLYAVAYLLCDDICMQLRTVRAIAGGAIGGALAGACFTLITDDACSNVERDG